MSEVLAQQLNLVLESAEVPAEKYIYSEIEMKNMTRVMKDTFIAALRTAA